MYLGVLGKGYWEIFVLFCNSQCHKTNHHHIFAGFRQSETNLPGSDSPGSSLPTTTAISQGAKLLRTRLNPCFGRKGSEFRWQMLAGIWMLDVICWVAPFCCSWRSGQHRDYSSDRQNVKICSAILKLLVWQDDQDGLKQQFENICH